MRTRESDIELHEVVQNIERQAEKADSRSYNAGWWADGKPDTQEEIRSAFYRGKVEGLNYAVNILNQFIGVENGRS